MGAQVLPPVPLEHHRIRASTSTDVSKQLISSDCATAVSLPHPQGDQGLVTGTLLPSTRPSGPCHPAGIPQGSGWAETVAKGPSGPHRGPLACVAHARGCSQAGVLIPHISFARQEPINSGWEPERHQRLIRLRRAAAPPAGINAACCRK